MRKSYREESRKDYGRNTDPDLGLANDDLKLGDIMRIADATEAMAKNHVQLQNDRDMYKRMYEGRVERVEELKRQVSALRGVITKLKKRAQPTGDNPHLSPEGDAA